jgi:PAS domain S-box-containing protein
MGESADRRFLGLLEAAPDAMVCVERDGRIALVNAQAERLFGYSKAELAGKPVEILVPEAARGVHPGHRATYAANPRPRPMADGTTVVVSLMASPITDSAGKITGISTVSRDVSERLQAQAERERLRTQAERDRMERQLQQSQRLESLGQLAGGVAHDFNNLLGVISSYAAFVAEELESESPPNGRQTVRSDIEQVRRAADRAAELTHQLLAFARREVIQPRVLNLNDMVASVEWPRCTGSSHRQAGTSASTPNLGSERP